MLLHKPGPRAGILIILAVLALTALVRTRTGPVDPASGETQAVTQPSGSRSLGPADNVSRKPSAIPVRPGGQRLELKLEDLPAGPLREELATLPDAVRESVLDELARQPRPRLDLANSIHVTPSGSLYYVCRERAFAGAALVEEAEAEPLSSQDTAPFPGGVKTIPATHPPIHHSRPEATKVIFLDFNGHLVKGTEWNAAFGSTEYHCGAYGTDSHQESFSENEQAAIEAIWSRVAQHFRNFDVDVTTEEPDQFGPDTVHILITPDMDLNGIENPNSDEASGVAFLNVFGTQEYSKKTPVFVYFQGLGTAATGIIAAHEAGHYLGLSHDGDATHEYYPGHPITGNSDWSPIMGTGKCTVTNWSKGEYYGANNHEDDQLKIGQKLGWLPDEEPGTMAGAMQLPANGSKIWYYGLLNSSSDIDWYWLDIGSGIRINLSVMGEYNEGYSLSPEAALYDASGNLVLSNGSPAAAGSCSFQEINFPPGRYYLKVTAREMGTPLANPPTGFTSYGSIGRYVIRGDPVPNDSALAPLILEQPASKTALCGTEVSFSTSVAGNPTAYCQWEVSRDDGATWSSLLGYVQYSNSENLRILAALPGMDGWQFRCVVKNEHGSVTSQPVTLSVITTGEPMEPTSQPADVMVYLPDENMAEFTFGFENLTGDRQVVLWEAWDENRNEWRDVYSLYYSAAGKNTTTLTLHDIQDSWDGTQVRCHVINVTGEYFSDPATLQVRRLARAFQYIRESRIRSGDPVRMGVRLGNPEEEVTYQWQRLLNGDSAWEDVTDQPGISGSRTSRLDIASAGSNLDGSSWRCVITNSSGDRPSDAFGLSVGPGYEAAAVKAAGSQKGSLLIRSDGSLWGLGNGFPFGMSSLSGKAPRQIVAEGVVDCAITDTYTLFVKSDGTLWGMGDNYYKQMGATEKVYLQEPTRLAPGFNDVIRCSASEKTGLFLRSDGSLWVMGYTLQPSTVYQEEPLKLADNVVHVTEDKFLTSKGVLYQIDKSYIYTVEIFTNVIDYAKVGTQFYLLNTKGEVWRYWGAMPVLIYSDVAAISTYGGQLIALLKDGSLLRKDLSYPGSSTLIDSGVSDFWSNEDSVFYFSGFGWLWGYGQNANGNLGQDIPQFYNGPQAVGVITGSDYPPGAPAWVKADTMPGYLMVYWPPAAGARDYRLWAADASDPLSAVLVADHIKQCRFAYPIKPGQDIPEFWVEASNTYGYSGRSPGSTLISDGPGIQDYEDFLQAYLDPRDRQTSTLSDKTADPDGDGLPNFGEYGFATDPMMPDSVSWFTEYGDGMKLCLLRRRGVPDIDYRVEASGDMNTWSTLDASAYQVEPVGTDLEKVMVPVSALQSSGFEFVRMKVLRVFE